MKKAKAKPPRHAIKKRFKASFFDDFYSYFTCYCIHCIPFEKETVLDSIILHAHQFDFKKRLKDSKKEKPLQLELSGIKAGIYDFSINRFVEVAEYVFKNLEIQQTQNGWCQFEKIQHDTMLKIPLNTPRYECWIVFFFQLV